MALRILLLTLFVGTDARSSLRAKEFKQELQGVLSDILGHGHGVDQARLDEIQGMLTPMFRALPKNRQGHLSAPVMRYVVQRYFSQRHGWVVRGFEPHAQAVNLSQSEEGDHILQSKLPDYVRTALEDKFAHEGFALGDTAMMVAVVERLAFDEVVRGVEVAFRLNKISTTQRLSHDVLLDALSSYLIIEMLEGSTESPEAHALDKESVNEIYSKWDDAYLFLKDVVNNDGFVRTNQRNPFVDSDTFLFQDTTRIAQRLSEDFGPMSNHECNTIKASLVSMDSHTTGRVKLSDFYSKSLDGTWEFQESANYLRALGALDESSVLHGPQVIIPNYISGMANCITSSTYYSICCFNDCDRVFQHLEHALSAPTATVPEIIQAVNSMNPSGFQVDAELRTKLQEVAALHNGQVPLHGRLFAQWIHYAFPQECPYPHVSGTANPETPMRFEGVAGEGASLASDAEIEQYIMSEAAHAPPSREVGKGMWNLHEAVLESSTPSDKAGSSIVFAVILRTLYCLCGGISMLGMLGGFVFALERTVFPQFQAILAPKGQKLVEYDV